jgi:hypothetical protein
MCNRMDRLHFPGRDVPPYAEYASPAALVERRIYYRLHFLHDEMTIPELEPLVFIGRNLDEGDEDYLYLQDADSYLAGLRYGDDTQNTDIEGDIHRVSSATPLVYEFERALDRLLYYSLKGKGD